MVRVEGLRVVACGMGSKAKVQGPVIMFGYCAEVFLCWDSSSVLHESFLSKVFEFSVAKFLASFTNFMYTCTRSPLGGSPWTERGLCSL